MLEGKYHTGAAVSMVLSSGLHKFRAQGDSIVTDGERLNAMWSVFILDRCSTATEGSPSNFNLDAEDTRIDAPWPMEITDYARVCLSSLSQVQ